MKIYTKQGDGGRSVLFDGTRVPKNHQRLETYGTVDELNSHLGVAIASCRHESLKNLLIQLQGHLLDMGSDLATPPGSRNESKVRRIPPELITFLEGQIDEATAQLSVLKKFILPGGSETAARLHVARTVCRRAERLLVTLQNAPDESVGAQPLIYLNRLSDLLFVLARRANQLDGFADVEWNST